MAGYLDIAQIKKILPHRYPFLLLDRVMECEPKVRVLALKNLTINEIFFQGHYPDKPILPGVLMIEAMVQASAILIAKSDNKFAIGANYFLSGVDGVRFRRQVVPGDSLILEANFIKRKFDMWLFACNAKVCGEFASSAKIICKAVTT